ncbi:glycosyltransferase [bacterium]|nr:glycosyltransferase [bacterium]
MDKKVKVSVIVPAYNEEGNIAPLFEAFDKLRRKVDFRFELILVDDGSTDGTAERARSLMKKYRFVKLVSYRANQGKTYAIMRGLEVARGDYVVIFDADLQFDPEDIPPMVKKLDAGADVVAGYKVGKYQKPVVSRVYNLFGKILFRVPVRDMNAMKALRREVLEQMPFRPDWHRYIVVWAHTHGYKIVEHPVKLRPRLSGKSKYRGIGRVFIGFFDLLSVWFQLTFVRRPMLFFGTLGIFTFGLAFLIGVVALILRFGFNLGYRPLLTLVVMLANIGLLLMIGGFLGEIIEGVQQRVRKLESQMRILSARMDELAAEKSRKNNSGRGNSRRSSKRSKSSGGRRTKSERAGTSSAKPEETLPEPVREEKDESPEQAESSPVEPSSESAQPEMIWGRRVRKKH